MSRQYQHEIVYQDIKQKILEGYYPAGSLLPREIDLAELYRVSRHTIRQATGRLSREGMLKKVKGVGTYVRHPKSDYSLYKMMSFSEQLNAQDGKPNSIVLQADRIKPDRKIAELLSLQKGDDIFFVERIRRNNDLNLCLEKTYINAQLCPDLDQYVSPNASLYRLYEQRYGLDLADGVFELEATNASSEISKKLDIAPQSAVLLMHATVHLTDGMPLYFVQAYYVGSRYVFSTLLTRENQ